MEDAKMKAINKVGLTYKKKTLSSEWLIEKTKRNEPFLFVVFAFSINVILINVATKYIVFLHVNQEFLGKE